MAYMTEGSVRKAFWESHPEYEQVKGKRQNDYNATIRSAFVEYVDALHREYQISDNLVKNVTL